MALKGIRVLEFAGLAPAPYCGMILADFGATVLRIDKVENQMNVDCLGNGKLSIALNLKHDKGIDIVKKLSKSSDVLIEPHRPGVMEKLGLGPEVLMEENNKLIYARLSGYGQTGPMAHKAGHDINFISASGVLSMLGWTQKKPTPPINLLADFGGGGLMCALGIVMALYERSSSGRGQLVDCSMTAGSAYLSSWLFRSQSLPIWGKPKGRNLLDGGFHAYDTYETEDGKWMTVGSLEPQFFNNLLIGLGVQLEDMPESTEEAKRFIGLKFKEHTQQHWIQVFKELDACVTPVLSVDEAARNEGYTKSWEGHWAPEPSPRLSRTPGRTLADLPAIAPGQHTSQILTQLGYTSKQIGQLYKQGVIGLSENAKL